MDHTQLLRHILRLFVERSIDGQGIAGASGIPAGAREFLTDFFVLFKLPGREAQDFKRFIIPP